MIDSVSIVLLLTAELVGLEPFVLPESNFFFHYLIYLSQFGNLGHLLLHIFYF